MGGPRGGRNSVAQLRQIIPTCKVLIPAEMNQGYVRASILTFDTKCPI